MRSIALILFIGCSTIQQGCDNAPEGLTCVSDPAMNGFQCYDSTNKENSFVLYTDSENFVAHPPDYYEELLNWCRGGHDKVKE